jgi:3',5'-cyclic-AMP phosphodiesterase
MQQLGWGLVVGALGLPIMAEPRSGKADQESGSETRIALLADAHLPDDNSETPTARNLMTAVSEINAQIPPVDLVFFVGDLTDNGESKTLELGREILTFLKAPYWLLPGEQDAPAAVSPLGRDTFANFSFSQQGVHFCGCNTGILDATTGKIDFQVGPHLHSWLSQELEPLAPEMPLVMLTHAPLYRLFQPWRWWTKDSETLHDLLKVRKNVYLLHGHVHQNITLQYQNLTFQGLRSTAWPLPDVRVGCGARQPVARRTDTRNGCGWTLLTINRHGAINVQDQVWDT